MIWCNTNTNTNTNKNTKTNTNANTNANTNTNTAIAFISTRVSCSLTELFPQTIMRLLSHVSSSHILVFLPNFVVELPIIGGKHQSSHFDPLCFLFFFFFFSSSVGLRDFQGMKNLKKLVFLILAPTRVLLSGMFHAQGLNRRLSRETKSV